jgi:pimeloyl-ACP methyl ester carboxylesterase
MRSRPVSIRRWIRRGFLLWAVVSLAWLANSVRTQGVSEGLLRSTQEVSVVDGPTAVEFRQRGSHPRAALIFICGSGIHPHAYAPLLRPIAESGYSVFIIKLPYRFAPLASHKDEVVHRVRQLIAAHAGAPRLVVAGHSLGGALAARVAQADHTLHAAFVLIGTTHPKDDDLSRLDKPFAKIYATNDGIAPVDRIASTKRLLPKHTKWVEIRGGNHSQFGHYGHHLFDGKAMISREEQQAITREVLFDLLGRGAT